MRRNNGISEILSFLFCGGHKESRIRSFKVLQYGSCWSKFFKDDFENFCVKCQVALNIKKNDCMPLQPILDVEIFYLRFIYFMGQFPNSNGYEYILMVADYVSRWVEAIPTRTNNHKIFL